MTNQSNVVEKPVCSRCWQLAENLNGRISRSVDMVDDSGELADELEARGVSVRLVADYDGLKQPNSSYAELDRAKLKALLEQCSTQLILVVAEPEGTGCNCVQPETPEYPVHPGQPQCQLFLQDDPQRRVGLLCGGGAGEAITYESDH